MYPFPPLFLQWLNVLPRFAEMGHRAVAIDLPGFGNSYCPLTTPDIHYYAKVIICSIKALRARSAEFSSAGPIAIAKFEC